MKDFAVEKEYIKRVSKSFEFPSISEDLFHELSAENQFALEELGFPAFMQDIPSSIIRDGNTLLIEGNLGSSRKIIDLEDNRIYWMHDDSVFTVNSNLITYFYSTCIFSQLSVRLSRLVNHEDDTASSVALLKNFLIHIQQAEEKHGGFCELNYWTRVVEDLLGYIE